MVLRRQSGMWPLALLSFLLPVGSALYAQVPAMPTPTPVPASSIPSVPAASDQTQPPASNSAPANSAQPVQMPQPVATASLPAMPAYAPESASEGPDRLGSTYIPVDSWIYPAAMRLYSLGYLDTIYISMRPWTRRSLLHAVQQSQPSIVADGNQEAMEILAKLNTALAEEQPGPKFARGRVYGPESFYTRVMGISGTTLRDSYHLGQTLVNDYGRPYEAGFNNVTGFSSVNEMGWFSLYVRGEYQYAPSATGYSVSLAQALTNIDGIPYGGTNANQATIPQGPIATQNHFRLQEANLSMHLLNHEISFGKSDSWIGPAQGGSMGWSNNAENIYSFRINRVEPLHIPLLSWLIGPVRYDFFVGSLQGHTFPNDPWVHSETFEFHPSSNFEFGYQRTVIWGGKGHEPINLHSFLRSFFSVKDTEDDPSLKGTASDPGARFATFNFAYRLPFFRHTLTLYTDSMVHDDVAPTDAPRRASYRPGIYLSQFPLLHKLDLRAEASSTDTSTLVSINGSFNYFEAIQRQGYTNKGFIMGDWIGREAKGGQAWLTYHLSGNEWVQLEYLNKKTPKDFIPGGTTQNQFKLDVVKRFHRDIELNAWLQYERWKAPIYMTGQQNDTTVAFQLTWFPKLRTQPGLTGR